MSTQLDHSKYQFRTDPSHGWYRVPRANVFALGVFVTKFSYVDTKYFWLEEDTDGPAYFKALKKADPAAALRFEACPHRHSDSPSVIRNKESWDLGRHTAQLVGSEAAGKADSI